MFIITITFVLLLLTCIAPTSSTSTTTTPCNVTTPSGICYGHELKSAMFLLAPNFTNLNHGSFGTMPKPVVTRQHEYVLEQESYPDTWFRVNYYTYIEQARDVIANLIHASVDDVVLVENASSAVNSILRSLGLRKGDKVLHLSTAYGMVTETLHWLIETEGIVEIIVPVPFPIPADGGSAVILTALEGVLRQHPDVKVCIYSHLSSMPALIEPIADMTSLTRALAPNALVLIDGAHAPGQVPVNVRDIGATFYLGNAHKWLYAPKGTAFLWVAPSSQGDLSPEPTVISSSGQHDYVDRYAYTGTRDYTAFATLPTAIISFRKDMLGGEELIRAWCHNLAITAARMLTTRWNTSLLVADEAMIGFMFNVVLPSTDADAIAYVQTMLDMKYQIYIVYGWVDVGVEDGVQGVQGQLSGVLPASSSHPSPSSSTRIYFSRLSAQVYNELSDFERLGELVPQLLKEYYEQGVRAM